VGEYFLDSLFSDIDSLALYAGSHRKVFGFHRLLAKRFPYAIYYQVDAEGVAVASSTGLSARPIQNAQGVAERLCGLDVRLRASVVPPDLQSGC